MFEWVDNGGNGIGKSKKNKISIVVNFDIKLLYSHHETFPIALDFEDKQFELSKYAALNDPSLKFCLNFENKFLLAIFFFWIRKPFLRWNIWKNHYQHKYFPLIFFEKKLKTKSASQQRSSKCVSLFGAKNESFKATYWGIFRYFCFLVKTQDWLLIKSIC